MHVTIKDTSNETILFGVMNFLLKLSKEREFNGYSDSTSKMENRKKKYIVLYKKIKKYQLRFEWQLGEVVIHKITE